MISAASTAPERTFASASSRFCTSTRSIAVNSVFVYVLMSSFWLPRRIVPRFSGTWLRNATRGFSGPLESAKPISVAIAIG